MIRTSGIGIKEGEGGHTEDFLFPCTAVGFQTLLVDLEPLRFGRVGVGTISITKRHVGNHWTNFMNPL
jgi:hypothetical protein